MLSSLVYEELLHPSCGDEIDMIAARWSNDRCQGCRQVRQLGAKFRPITEHQLALIRLSGDKFLAVFLARVGAD